MVKVQITLTREHKNRTPSPQISICNTNIELLRWIKSVVGFGKIVAKTKYKEHHKWSYTWYAGSANNSLRFLEQIKSFLIIKKKMKLVEKIKEFNQ